LPAPEDPEGGWAHQGRSGRPAPLLLRRHVLAAALQGARGEPLEVSSSPGSYMGIFERFLSVWVALAIAVGVGLGLVLPAAFEVVARLELARVNLVVAVLIWLMIYPMMLKVEP